MKVFASWLLFFYWDYNQREVIILKFKKLLALGLAVALSVTSLVGCSQSSSSSSNSSSEATSKREERIKNDESGRAHV